MRFLGIPYEFVKGAKIVEVTASFEANFNRVSGFFVY
jgi:hypothetical protein